MLCTVSFSRSPSLRTLFNAFWKSKKMTSNGSDLSTGTCLLCRLVYSDDSVHFRMSTTWLCVSPSCPASGWARPTKLFTSPWSSAKWRSSLCPGWNFTSFFLSAVPFHQRINLYMNFSIKLHLFKGKEAERWFRRRHDQGNRYQADGSPAEDHRRKAVVYNIVPYWATTVPSR
jgi:hypothetical protein